MQFTRSSSRVHTYIHLYIPSICGSCMKIEIERQTVAQKVKNGVCCPKIATLTGSLNVFLKQQDALSPRPTQLQPQPEIARYGESYSAWKSHSYKNTSAHSLYSYCEPVRTLCSGARLRISRSTTNISAQFGTLKGTYRVKRGKTERGVKQPLHSTDDYEARKKNQMTLYRRREFCVRHQRSGKKAALLVTVSTMLLRRWLVRACYLSLTFASYVSACRSISIAYH